MVLLSYNTTDTFRRSKRIWLYHSPTLCRLSGTPKTTKSKEDKHFSWHLDDIYQNAFKHMEHILAYLNLSKRSTIYTDTSKRQVGSVDIMTTGQSPSSATTEVVPWKYSSPS